MPPAKCKLCANNAINMLTLDEYHNNYNLLEVVESLTLIHVSGTVHANSLICKPCADCLCLVKVKVDEYRRAFGGEAEKTNSKTNGRISDTVSSSKPVPEIVRASKSLDYGNISPSKTTSKSAARKLNQSLIFPKETVNSQKPNGTAKANQIGSVDCNSDSDADVQNVSRLSLDTYRTSTRLEGELVVKTTQKKPKIERQRRKSIYHFTCEYCGFETTTIKGIQTHLVEEHDIKRPRVFECKPCGLKYTVKINLDLHNKKWHAKENDQQAIVSNDKAEPKADAADKIELSKVTSAKGNTSISKHSHVADNSVDALTEDRKPEATTVTAKEGSKNKKKSAQGGAKSTVAVSTMKGATKPRNVNDYYFSCDHCPFGSIVAKTFANHLADAHGIIKPRIYKCQLCSNSYYRNQVLQKHVKNVHYQQKEEAGDKNSANKADDENNDNDDNDDVENDISYDKIDDSKEHSTAHAYDTLSHASSVVAKIKPLDVQANRQGIRSIFDFKCSHCAFATNQANAFRNHLSEVHDSDESRIFACDQCAMKYQHNKNLKRHIMVKHGSKSQDISDPKVLKEEEHEKKSPEKRKLKTASPKSQKRKSEPETQLEIFATPPPPPKQQKRISLNLTVTQSPSESTSTSTPSSPVNHFSPAHNLDVSLMKTKAERLTCSKCMKHFKNKEKLESHMNKRHRKQPLPSCHSCDKTFTTPEAFAKHRSCASCVKDLYRCEVANCQKSFSDKAFLLTHIKEKHPNVSYQFEDDTE